MADPYDRNTLASAAAASTSWADLMRRLGMKASGGRRRVLQEKAAAHGIDTSHFKRRSPWHRYTDEGMAAAVATSTTLCEVAQKLRARPTTGALSHIRRRIDAAGIDVSHFPGLSRPQFDLPIMLQELKAAAASATSIRDAARHLGVPDNGRSRAVLARMLRESGTDTSHFRNARLALPEDRLRDAAAKATSFADVMRTLGLPVNDTNHRRVRRRCLQLDLDTSHFKRKTWGPVRTAEPRRIAEQVLRISPQGSPRVNRERLHRALGEVGRPYQCASCGNEGTWLGKRITLQIDHVNGDWLDNRSENLRYLCPNCHALTDTWCRNRRRKRSIEV
ncbi:HNH endonuclease [Streptomyces sp. AV19]|uniref:HNH endonuclease signature motif containing protein n=1 Tax=Streptomyces sp. AV19 TaxID=2793068 RepID=UPI0018FEBAB0|nr:HNH endonuclease signature motif containing protein [Streptomyces sp. AV19]MBH1932844.1 HNH endonuclease [Streptomyces sp. AV19]MDG4531523.1 HNH endonuclease [Streptomyces sp. AV19]